MAKADSVHTIPNLRTAIARIEKIAAEAGDHLLLGDGPPHPDATLLDLCGELLFRMGRSRALLDEERALFSPMEFDRLSGAEQDSRRSRSKELWAQIDTTDSEIRRLLSKVKKLPARTAAGIYSKALVVRCSRTGAALLAMSLAEDLVSNPALRASLWGAEPEAACEAPGNVVALPLRTAGRA